MIHSGDLFLWGIRGSGKTLGAVIEAWSDYVEDTEIWANFPLKHIPHREIKLIEIVDMVENAKEFDINKEITFILDETHTQADSRSTQTAINKYLTAFVSQCRKRGVRMIYTSQFIAGYDIRMRQLTDKIIACNAPKNFNDIGIGTPKRPEPLYFEYRVFDINLRKWTMHYRISREIARKFYVLYRTEQPIATAPKIEVTT